MPIHFSPITPALGATVQGISLATIDSAQFDALYRIWQKHHVVVLRGQALTNIQFERFSAMLGELDPPAQPGGGAQERAGACQPTPQVVLRHQWRLGDVVLWNNLTTMHRRDAFPTDQFRTLHRSQIKGKYVPTAAAQKEAA